jgi:hypothetical protein
MKSPKLLAVALCAGCAGPADAPGETAAPAAAAPAAAAAEPADDGSYLARIDPLGGQWLVRRIGDSDLMRFEAWVTFSGGGFLNHGAGCGGGHPAFYRLEGERLDIVRREPVRIGRCGSVRGAAESERALAAFLDRATRWHKPDAGTLVLSASDGTTALLTRPEEPHPELAGRWIIESIGGEPLVTEVRPPVLTIAMGTIGAHADCNSMGAPISVPAPGRLSVTEPIVATEIGCAAEDQAEDDRIAGAMAAATGYRLDGDRLLLSGGPVMVLRRPPAPDRRLAGVYEHCGNTLPGANHDGPVTLEIDGRTMRDNAGCSATYTASGPELSLRLSDGPACADPSPPHVPGEPIAVGGDISPLAVARPDGYAFTEAGQLVLRTRRGLLTLCRRGAPRPIGG